MKTLFEVVGKRLVDVFYLSQLLTKIWPKQVLYVRVKLFLRTKSWPPSFKTDNLEKDY